MLKCYYSVFRSLLNPCLEALMTANQSLCVCYYERSLEPSPEGIVLNKPQHPLYFLQLYTINHFRDICSSVCLEQQAQGRVLSWCWALLSPASPLIPFWGQAISGACLPKPQPIISCASPVPVAEQQHLPPPAGGCSEFLGLSICPCLLSVQAGSALWAPLCASRLAVGLSGSPHGAEQPPCPAGCTACPCHDIPRSSCCCSLQPGYPWSLLAAFPEVLRALYSCLSAGEPFIP